MRANHLATTRSDIDRHDLIERRGALSSNPHRTPLDQRIRFRLPQPSHPRRRHPRIAAKHRRRHAIRSLSALNPRAFEEIRGHVHNEHG
jgi:hypothetical protein